MRAASLEWLSSYMTTLEDGDKPRVPIRLAQVSVSLPWPNPLAQSA